MIKIVIQGPIEIHVSGGEFDAKKAMQYLVANDAPTTIVYDEESQEPARATVSVVSDIVKDDLLYVFKEGMQLSTILLSHVNKVLRDGKHSYDVWEEFNHFVTLKNSGNYLTLGNRLVYYD